jgi:hypothetical protein
LLMKTWVRNAQTRNSHISLLNHFTYKILSESKHTAYIYLTHYRIHNVFHVSYLKSYMIDVWTIRQCWSYPLQSWSMRVKNMKLRKF